MMNVQLHKESSVYRVIISAQVEFVLSSLLLSSIVSALKEALFSCGREVLRQILEQLDDLWLREKPGTVEARRFFHRTVRTSLGMITFQFRQAKKDGKHFCPLLETLGIAPRQQITEDAQALGLLASLYTSYRKALKIAGFGFSLGSLWRAVQEEGNAYRDRQDQALYYYSEGVPTHAASSRDFAIVMMDEIWLRGRKKKKWLMVKTARLLVVRWQEKEGVYEFEPVCVFASVRPDQAQFLRKARQFFDAISGLSQIPHIVVLTDGCSMGKAFCAFYPNQAIWQLDWWHLWNAVHKGCKFEKNLELRIWDLLNVEKLDEALTLLSAYREAMVSLERKLEALEGTSGGDSPARVTPRVFWSSRQRQELERLRTYLDRNRAGIYAVKALIGVIPGEYLPFGSGPVERLQAVMIAYRMKKQGKHWSVEGADNLIALLSRERNGETVEAVLEQGLQDLAEWERLCQAPLDRPKQQPPSRSNRGMDFSPLPISTVVLLRRGKVESFYRPLQTIGEMKMLPRTAEAAERRDAVSLN